MRLNYDEKNELSLLPTLGTAIKCCSSEYHTENDRWGIISIAYTTKQSMGKIIDEVAYLCELAAMPARAYFPRWWEKYEVLISTGASDRKVHHGGTDLPLRCSIGWKWGQIFWELDLRGTVLSFQQPLRRLYLIPGKSWSVYSQSQVRGWLNPLFTQI